MNNSDEIRNESKTGLGKYIENLMSLKSSFAGSFLRSGMPTSDKSRTAVVVNNFFLHLHGAKTHTKYVNAFLYAWFGAHLLLSARNCFYLGWFSHGVLQPFYRYRI